jgi:multiple sugar transport system substrate-binding protein
LRTFCSRGAFKAALAATMAAVWLAAGVDPAPASTLVINSNASDPAPRAAWDEAIQRFRAENPDIEVRLNVFDHESYKKAIRNWLTSAPPDVVFWFAGTRMRRFAELSLFLDVSGLFTAGVKGELDPAAVDLVTLNGRQYGIPYAYYHVGLFFRRDLLEKAGVGGPPADWPALLAACDKLKTAGLVPIAIGTKDLWPAAAWFDYLDLRTNGHRFHMDLMRGRVAYTDARVRAVFARWRELLDRRCFAPHHASAKWQESQALLYQGRAAMMLIGNYIVPSFPPEVRNQMDFAPFPKIDPRVGAYEDAPMNSLHIPARARNPEAAKRFLAYVLRADVQEGINRAILNIPVNRNAAIADDRFLDAGRKLLSSADALAQFFDRDTDEELATIAMKGFQEFMLKPDRLDGILATIERARQRIYKAR